MPGTANSAAPRLTDAGDPRQHTTALSAIAVDSREAVDAMVRKAVATGGSPALDPQDHGLMAGASTTSNGNHWEVFSMDPAAVQG